MRARHVLGLAGLFLLVLALGVWVGRTSAPARVTSDAGLQEKTIQASGQKLTVELAVTPAQRELGLGGRTSLAEDRGMLFVFDHDSKYAFWMKDMRFAIDIIWLSAEGRVVYIVPNLAPSSYPASFAPPEPARYVLELRAGWAARHGLTEGDKVSL